MLNGLHLLCIPWWCFYTTHHIHTLTAEAGMQGANMLPKKKLITFTLMAQPSKVVWDSVSGPRTTLYLLSHSHPSLSEANAEMQQCMSVVCGCFFCKVVARKPFQKLVGASVNTTECFSESWKPSSSLSSSLHYQSTKSKCVSCLFCCRELVILVLAISCLHMFAQSNWTGPPVSIHVSDLLPPALLSSRVCYHFITLSSHSCSWQANSLHNSQSVLSFSFLFFVINFFCIDSIQHLTSHTYVFQISRTHQRVKHK